MQGAGLQGEINNLIKFKSRFDQTAEHCRYFIDFLKPFLSFFFIFVFYVNFYVYLSSQLAARTFGVGKPLKNR